MYRPTGMRFKGTMFKEAGRRKIKGEDGAEGQEGL